jgi:hypothetical protein
MHEHGCGGDSSSSSWRAMLQGTQVGRRPSYGTAACSVIGTAWQLLSARTTNLKWDQIFYLSRLQTAALRRQNSWQESSSGRATGQLPCLAICWQPPRTRAHPAPAGGNAPQSLQLRGSGCDSSRAPTAACQQTGSRRASGRWRRRCMTPRPQRRVVSRQVPRQAAQ